MSNQGWTDDDDLDMGSASTEPPPPPPVDIYEGEVVKAEAAASKEGKPALKLQVKALRVFGGDELPRKHTYFLTVPVSKEAAFRIKGIAEAAGIEPPTRSNFGAISDFAGEVTGKSVIFRSKIRTYTDGGVEKVAGDIDRFFTEEKAKAARAATPAASADNQRARRAG